jgi:AraC-like DNA-binding protein
MVDGPRIEFTILPAPETLNKVVDRFRIAHYVGKGKLAIRVCPHGFPGIVFQHSQGRSAIENIVKNDGQVFHAPTLFVHGQVTQLSVMNFKGPYLTIQVVLKPHALKSLFDLADASLLTNGAMEPGQFGAETLNTQLLDANDDQQRLDLLTDFLCRKLEQANENDPLIEESLNFINQNLASVTINSLVQHFYISKRQFQKRFVRAVGIPPQYYIRVKRFNEAMKLIDTGKYETLADVAYALGFFDQSHFIRDIKEFSGITPTSISQKANDFHRDRVGSSYLY